MEELKLRNVDVTPTPHNGCRPPKEKSLIKYKYNREINKIGEGLE